MQCRSHEVASFVQSRTTWRPISKSHACTKARMLANAKQSADYPRTCSCAEAFCAGEQGSQLGRRAAGARVGAARLTPGRQLRSVGTPGGSAAVQQALQLQQGGRAWSGSRVFRLRRASNGSLSIIKVLRRMYSRPVVHNRLLGGEGKSTGNDGAALTRSSTLFAWSGRLLTVRHVLQTRLCHIRLSGARAPLCAAGRLPRRATTASSHQVLNSAAVAVHAGRAGDAQGRQAGKRRVQHVGQLRIHEHAAARRAGLSRRRAAVRQACKCQR